VQPNINWTVPDEINRSILAPKEIRELKVGPCYDYSYLDDKPHEGYEVVQVLWVPYQVAYICPSAGRSRCM
jgi:hypothetical protein